jgi:hypothetical protein
MKLQLVIRIGLVSLMLAAAFIAGQQFPRTVGAQTRQKWEYQIIASGFTGSGQVDKLNKLGDDGWEVVTLNASSRVLLRRAKRLAVWIVRILQPFLPPEVARIGSMIGKSSQKHGIHNAENRDVGETRE